jgi:FkbM family methyltransferase
MTKFWGGRPGFHVMALPKSLSHYLRAALSRLSGKPGRVPIRYFRQFLSDRPVIVEAGSHNGVDTANLARAWPRGKVFGFEPVPALQLQVEHQIKGLANAICFPLALGARPGQAELFISSGVSDGSSSLLRPTGHLEEHPGVLFREKISVPVVTLDSWAQSEGIAGVDFLWLDLQGGELAALQGAARILPTVRVIYSEVSLKPMYEGAPLYPEFRASMESWGFRVAREELSSADMGNVVFVRR